ncbi:MAG: LamG-like jellyroll fold domain-containing protein [Kiritimatiellia bacterium]
MKNKPTLFTFITALILSMTPRAGIAQPIEGWATGRVEENLGRGVLVQLLDDNAGVYINWRQLKEDGPAPSYNVYVDRTGDETYDLLNSAGPITETTDIVDPAGELGDYYYVESITTSTVSDAFAAHDQPYISIDVGGSFEKVGVGDLDGDGILDFVIRTPAGHIDPYSSYWKASTHTLKLKAFNGLTGAHMWTYDLGWNIEAGIWYSPYIVYDFDGDGKAEVAAKTGLTPQDDGEDYEDERDVDGRVESDSEFLAIIDGITGNVVDRAPWPDREGLHSYNWCSRNMLTVAYLDGNTPFVIASRGTYGVKKVQAYTFNNDTVTADPNGYWDSTHEIPGYTLANIPSSNFSPWLKQGAHTLSAGDLDGDGRDEIVLGACVLNSDLTGRWAMPNRYEQVDALYLGELNPDEPGLEIYMGMEYYPTNQPGSQTMVTASTGTPVWESEAGPHDINGVGMVSDLDPDYPGVESWGRDKSSGSSSRYNYYDADGYRIPHESLFFDKGYSYSAVYWDADHQRELITAGAVFDRKAEGPITRVDWHWDNGSTTDVYDFSAGKSAWNQDWNTWPGHSQVDFREGTKTGESIDYIEIVPQSGNPNWSMTWQSDPIAVNPGSTYFVQVNFHTVRNAIDFRMEMMAGGANLIPDAPTFSNEGTAEDVIYFAAFTVPPGVTEIDPRFVGGGTSTYRYQIKTVSIMEDNTPNRVSQLIAGVDRLWGDIMGDWREEIITSFGNELRIYSTRIPAEDRRVTYLQDPVYRADVANLAMGYANVPTASTLPAFESETIGGETVSLGDVNNGIAAQDNATGTGFIMWSETSVHTRFNPHQYNSNHLIAVKWTGSEWVYDTNDGYVSFTPQTSDVLIAEVDFSNDTITSLEGVTGSYQGIERGYASGDLTFQANVWDGSSNAGEFTVSGSTFTKNGGGEDWDFLVFNSADISGYGGQDGINGKSTSSLVSPDGASLTIEGNAWKKVPYNYTLTPDSVLEFTVHSSNVAEILAIGVDTNNTFDDDATTFQLAGSQTGFNWTLLNGGVYTEGETVSFRIPIGEDLSGTISYLTFIADDDQFGLAHATFSDVRIYEDTALQPTAYWDFDDGSGSTAMDLSANALDISLQGTYSWSTGQVGGALTLSGQSNSYGSVPDPEVLEDTDKLSFSFWVRPENVDGNARFIVSKRDAQNVNCAFSLFFWTGNRLFVDLDHNNNSNRHSTDTQFQNNTWYHVAVVYDGTLPQNERGRVYINGELDANSPFAVSSSSIPNYPSDFFLGTANSGYHRRYKGRVDDLLIFREALQESEVENLFEY